MAPLASYQVGITNALCSSKQTKNISIRLPATFFYYCRCVAWFQLLHTHTHTHTSNLCQCTPISCTNLNQMVVSQIELQWCTSAFSITNQTQHCQYIYGHSNEWTLNTFYYSNSVGTLLGKCW